MVHFLGHGAVLDDRALRRKVAAQHGDGASDPMGFFEGTNHVRARKAGLFQVFIALFVESALLKLFRDFLPASYR